MRRLTAEFGVDRVFLPVVHYANEFSFYRNIDLAMEASAHGVFLINQGIDHRGVLAKAEEVAAKDIWVGVNILGAEITESFVRSCQSAGARGIWVDNAHIDCYADSAHQPAKVDAISRALEHWEGLYFGGVAFKYQEQVPDDLLEHTASVSSMRMDVVTTSGPATGQMASLAKVQAMHKGLHPYTALALASGVSLANVDGFLPYVDAFLVATSIESSYGEFDAGKTKRLGEVINAYAQ